MDDYAPAPTVRQLRLVVVADGRPSARIRVPFEVDDAVGATERARDGGADVIAEVIERDGGRVAAVGVHHGVLDLGFHVLEQGVEGDTTPGRTEFRPSSDAVDIPS